MPRASTESRVQSLSREWTDKAVMTLAQIMMQPRAAEHARILAANSLLNRGWGLPVAQVEHNSNIQIEVREWLSWMRRPDIKMVDVTPSDTQSISSNANDINKLDTIEDKRVGVGGPKCGKLACISGCVCPPPAGGK